MNEENPQNVLESEKKQKPVGFLALKFDRHTVDGEERGEALICALKAAGLDVDCLVRDEAWGKKPAEHPVKTAFERIKQSNFLIVDASGETGFGMGSEAGFAKALGITVVVICPKGTVLGMTRVDIADCIIEYENLEELSAQVTNIISKKQETE